MASTKQTITKPFSRLMNGLAELQRWWPAYVENDGVGGLSVDPVLYRTQFGPETIEEEGRGLLSEANTPGIRVELIDNDGTQISGASNAQIQIIDSGTLNARAVITHPDSTTTTWRFVAPSGDGANLTYGSETIDGIAGCGVQSDSAFDLYTTGPFPVFATIQDFVDFLDTGYHLRANGADATTINSAKKAFLPHGIIGRSGGVAAVAANPVADADPRDTGDDSIPTTYKVRASVFMPMMLDNNQLSNAQTGPESNDIVRGPWDGVSGNSTGYFNFATDGMTRHDQSPDATTTPVFKIMGTSGDHKSGQVGSFSPHDTTDADHQNAYSNPDLHPDSSAYGGPSYRMRTALACFLKDGTYALADGGTLIPYTYDPGRTIGGMQAETIHAVWNGEEGLALDSADELNTEKQSSAQIFPLFDFVQGPLCPAPQGSNYDYDTSEGNYPAWLESAKYMEAFYANQRIQPRGRMCRPNPIRAPIYAIQREQDGSARCFIHVWVMNTNSGSRPNIRFIAGSPIYLHGITGQAGSDAVNTDYGGWRGTNDGAGLTASRRNFNGWWIPNTVSALTSFNKADIVDGESGTFQGIKLTIRINSSDLSGGFVEDVLPLTAGTQQTTAWISQGILGGTELEADVSDSATMLRGVNHYLIGRPLTYSQNTWTLSDGTMSPTGLGFNGGINVGNQSVVITAGQQATFPGRLDMVPLADAEEGAYTDDSKYIPRGISIVGADDTRFVLAPTTTASGGGSLRISAPQTAGLSQTYYATSVSGTGPTGVGSSRTPYMDSPISGATAPFHFSALAPLSHRWRSRGIQFPLISYMDTLTGRHGFDYTKPTLTSSINGVSAVSDYGRNRPYPVKERCGTKSGYGPLRADPTDFNSLESSGYLGWVDTFGSTTPSANRITPGQSTTLTGLTEIGCSPIWLDMEIRAFIPIRKETMTLIEFDTGEEDGIFGRHAMIRDPLRRGNNGNRGFVPLSAGTSIVQKSSDATAAIDDRTRPITTRNMTAVWMWGDSDWFKADWLYTKTDPANGWSFTTTAGGRFGSMGNTVGTGSSFTMTEGVHIIRTTFDQEGMSLVIDGTTVGKDTNVAKTVWGVSISQANAGGTSDGTSVDANGRSLLQEGTSLNKTQADLQIDEIILRQIPSPAMMPFNVWTTNQQVADVARYTGLTVEADNISVSKGMDVKASICPVVSNTGGPAVEGGTPYTGFEDIELGFVGGIGSCDLTALPADAIANGFVVRFQFYVPTSADTDKHPVDWSKTPVVRSWTIEYDLSPTASIACVGNTFNGDTTAPIDTKVGHIVSFRGTATTPDADRTVSKIKFDFGDGSATDFLLFADQTQTTNTFDVAHSYLTSGTYTATCTVQDDNGNETTSSSITVNVANAPPVAVLRAVPSLIRAGQPITLDGSESYDINAGGSIATYTFTPGDGSSATSGSSSSISHTYAAGGEYRATLVVVDADGTSSQTASAVIKVLPATLVVPLVFNTKPKGFSRNRFATMGQTPVLDAVYPEITDRGQRTDEFSLQGMFLKETANNDIAFVEELLLAGSLVEFMWEDVDYAGTATGKTFVGRITAFDYQREGGQHGQTPYTITLVREAGLGA